MSEVPLYHAPRTPLSGFGSDPHDHAIVIRYAAGSQTLCTFVSLDFGLESLAGLVSRVIKKEESEANGGRGRSSLNFSLQLTNPSRFKVDESMLDKSTASSCSANAERGDAVVLVQGGTATISSKVKEPAPLNLDINLSVSEKKVIRGITQFEYFFIPIRS